MKKTLQVLNRLIKDNYIKDYAIGGGIAAIYYIEPILTYDLDIFIIPPQPQAREKNVIDLSYVFGELTKRGYKWKGEHLIIEGIAVQFIPADDLETDAIRNARIVKYKGIYTKIFKAEHLIAVLVRAGRTKDIHKVELILEQSAVDRRKLEKLLEKYGLLNKFKQKIKTRGSK